MNNRIKTVRVIKDIPIPRETIDITPVGLSTPEGIQRVKRATEGVNDAARAFASAAAQFVDEHSLPLMEMISSNAGLRDDWHQFKALLGAYERKQEEFCRAVAGAPQS
jgi:hypothetical protein